MAAYNNAVYIFNDICKSLYSNEKLHIYARNLTIEDIEQHFTQAGQNAKEEYINNNSVKYGEVKKYEGNNNLKYPWIYEQEKNSGVNGVIKEDGISASDSYYTSREELTNQYKTASGNLLITQTYYGFNVPKEYIDNEVFYDMVFNRPSAYYLASRAVDAQEGKAVFSILLVDQKNRIYRDNVFDSNGNTSDDYSFFEPIQPIICLPLDIQIVPCEGENSQTNMHQLNVEN